MQNPRPGFIRRIFRDRKVIRPKELSGFDDRLKRESSIALRLGSTGNNNINCTQTTANVNTDLWFFSFPMSDFMEHLVDNNNISYLQSATPLD